MNIHTVHGFNYEKFMSETRLVREDFDKLWNSSDEKEQ